MEADKGYKELTERFCDIEWRKCRMSLRYYLQNYVYLQDRINQKVIRWGPAPHVLELIRLVQNWRDNVPRKPLSVIIFKSRQVWATSTICGIANWIVSFHNSSKVEEQSENEDVAKEMLERNVFINDHHPHFLKLKLYPAQEDLIGFPATGSKIITIPSTASAGRTSDATMVVCDEWEKHADAEEGFGAVHPAMAKGGLFIGASTIDKTKSDSFPKRIWEEARQGKNNFIPLFWGYYSVPGRDEQTYQRDTAGMPDWMRESEYPRNEKEIMTPTKAAGYFNHDILEKYLGECRKAVENRYSGLIKIYTPAITNRKFIFAIDSSQGMEDPAVGIVADAQTFEDVACFHGRISLEEQAKAAYELYKEYNEPLIAVERNASGLTLIEKLTNLGVKNWFYSDKEKQKPGWYTGSWGLNRDRILLEFAEQVHLRRKRIPMKDCIIQMFDFAWINGRPQAVRGKHDDWILCEAILGQVAKQVPSAIRITTAKYKG